MLVHDPVHHQLVLFGGRALDDTNETWTLEGDEWTRHTPAHVPDPRAHAYGLWDSARQRVTVFGGNASGQFDRARIWTWDGSDWSSFVPVSNPPPRRDAAVAYDSARDRIVLFGGVVDGSPDVTLADTWEFDGTGWRAVTPTTSPGDRGAALMGYDVTHQQMVLVNGYSESLGSGRSDTWTYDGSTWTALTNANTPRGSSLRMAWQPREQQLVIAGRRDTGRLTSWSFDGAAWYEQPGASLPLNGLADPGLTFDADLGQLVYLREENQEYRGFHQQAGGWQRFLPVAQPGGADLDQSALYFDAKLGEMRLLTGQAAGSGLQGWRWDGTMWRPLALGGARSPSSAARLSYDGARGVVVAYDGTTYELDADGWEALPTSASPATGGMLAYDPERRRSVAFGGTLSFGVYANATWTWDGAQWAELPLPTSPSPRNHAGMAFDERAGALILFGGMQMLDGRVTRVADTWTLTDNGWVELLPDGPIRLRDTPSMAYDRGRERVVMWAEQYANEAKLWEFDGFGWVGTEAPPIEGTAGIVGYDSAAARLLVHDALGRTWARASGDAPPRPVMSPDAGVADDAGNAVGVNAPPSGQGGAEDPGDSPAAADADAGDLSPRRGGDGCALTARGSEGGNAWLLLLVLGLLAGRVGRTR